MALSGCLPGGEVLPPDARILPAPPKLKAAPAAPQPGRTRPLSPDLPCPECGLQTRPSNLTCRAVPPPPEVAEAVLAFPDLPAAHEPVMVVHQPGASRIFLVERAGRVYRFDDQPAADLLTPALDLRQEVDPRGDAGLVAAALHPSFADNGQLFLSYTALGGTVTRSRVVRFSSQDGGASFDPESRRVLIDFDQRDPWRIHLNADMTFGPDGFLYVGFGDGGPQGDPDGNAQNPASFQGKILRLDVSGGDPYRIPADNPFVDSDARPEIFALGLRNPWRFSFDRDSGELWVGDVGFETWEEINQVVAGQNLGWPLLEGTDCHASQACDDPNLALPVAQYSHDVGASVTGGFVYRGRAIPALVGRYVFGDYISGDVWALTEGGEPELVARTGLRIVSFAEEPGGELLIVDFGSGRLFRLSGQLPRIETFAERLSATGCFRAEDPRQPAEGLVPFDVRVPFWSDGAVKRRFLALPDGQSAQIREDGSIFLPVGSVLAKEFFLGDRLIETRLMMKYREGQWTGASYIWDGDASDARLVADGDLLTATYGGVDWSYPNRPTCLDCHNGDHGLGMEVAQLDLVRTFSETGRVAGQLESFRRVGILEGDIPPVPRLPRNEDEGTLAERARAYLHVNCAVCHTRNGPTPVDMDLRFGTAMGEMRLCDVLPKEGDLGLPDARRLTPGSPGLSLLARRMRLAGPGRMPPVGPQLVDEAGAELVEDWISSLRGCP